MCDYVPPIQSADSYNGASHKKFTWSQTINDLDVLVNIPDRLTSPGDLKVHVSIKEMSVKVRKSILSTNAADSDDWCVIFHGELSFPIKKHETIWSMTPANHVHIHLEKIQERWWEALIVGEPRIELSKIDCSRDIDELGQCEQMKLQELMWKHRQRVSQSNKYQQGMEKKL